MDWRFNKTEKTALIVLGVLISAAVTAGQLIPQEQEDAPERITHIRSVLELQDARNRRRSLVVGYNYELMQKYAQDNGQTIEISISYGDSYLDSLRAGVVDLVAVPYSDSLQFDGLVSSHHIDSLSVWVMRAEDRHEMRHVQSWLRAWKHSEEYQETKEIFLRRFSPFRSRPRKVLSPYDEIIKAYADSTDIDWRMLAAVIYQESRFHIEARSHRGASGLMQMMPVAATRYGVSDPLDPEQNISAGAMMLRRLRDRYREVAADDVESFRFALAAYNAMREEEGGRLAKDIIEKGNSIGSMKNTVAERMPRIVAEYRAKLTAKMNEVLGESGVTEQRILAEAAIFADRTATDEETVRLTSHLVQLSEILNQGGAVGRKLDFLVQEINREINTIGSKANDLEVTGLVLEMKCELEKIREQIQILE